MKLLAWKFCLARMNAVKNTKNWIFEILSVLFVAWKEGVSEFWGI